MEIVTNKVNVTTVDKAIAILMKNLNVGTFIFDVAAVVSKFYVAVAVLIGTYWYHIIIIQLRNFLYQ